MAGDLRISMLVELNAQRGRAEAQALRNELDGLGKTARTTGQEAGGAAAGVNTLGAAGTKIGAEILKAAAGTAEFDAMVASLRLSINPLAAALDQAEIGIRSVAAAEELGALTSREAAMAHDQLTRSTEMIIAKMAQYASSADSSAAANARVETSMQRLIAANTGMAGSTGDSIAAQLQHGAALDDLRARFDPLFAASRRYELDLRAIADAERDGAFSATAAAGARNRAAEAMTPMTAGVRQFGAQAQNATHYATQLGYQANDIFMMIAAGQNPLMLMMQQGTQVTQVFGAMRAEGLKIGPAIRGSLLGMINPLSLVTMGAIALGAFAVQALMGMRKESLSLEDHLKKLSTTMDRLRENTRLLGDQKLDERFGSMTSAVQTLASALLELDRVSELKQLRDTLKSSIAESIEPTFMQKATLAIAQGQSPTAFAEVDLAADNFAALGTKMSYEELQKFRSELDALAKQGLIEEVVAKVADLKLEMTDGGPLTDLSEKAQKLFADLASVAVKTAEFEALFNGSGPKKAAERRADEVINSGLRENEIAQASLVYGRQSAEVRAIQARHATELLNIEITRLGIDAQGVQAEQLRANLKARQAQEETARQNAMAVSVTQMIGQYQQETEIARLTAAYGADSLEVSYARVAAERDVQVALLASQGYTGLLADSAIAAWDAARGIAAVNMAAGIGAAADEAILLAANLGISLNKAAALMGLGGKARKPGAPARVTFGGVGSVAPTGSGTALGFGPTDAAGVPQIKVDTSDNGGTSIPRTGRGGSGADSERNALDELIAAQKREIAVLRELDPVKRELLENAKALAKATPEERREVEALIRTRIAEKNALEAVQRAQEELRGTMKSAFVGWITGANSFRDALGQIAGKLAEMAASSAFDTIWANATNGGGGGGGGWFGNILKWISGGTPAHADGGMIAGAGGPREDNHLVRVSAGEYIVNAAATAGALPLLEMINAGVPMSKLVDIIAGRRMLAFADGGQVGVSSVGRVAPPSWAATSSASAEKADAAPSGKPPVIMNFNLNGATGNEEIQELLQNAITAAMTHYDREILPARVSRIAGAGNRERG